MGVVSVNWIAALVSGVASFAFGSVYHMSLAKPSMAAAGNTQKDIKSSQNAMTLRVVFVA